ncbi:MAG: FAD-dependent oxidoreductase [Pseudomonadota bacterium]
MSGVEQPPHIAVVGAGIMGLSTAWALHREGVRVSVFEQGPIPNPKGSSVDESRLIRHPYGDQPGYTAMVDQAFAAWGRLFDDLKAVTAGEPLYHETGTLVMDTGGVDGRAIPAQAKAGQESQWIPGSRRCLQALALDYQDLDGAGCAALVPGLRDDIVLDAFHLTTGGVLRAGRIVEVTADYLSRRGVQTHANRPVKHVDTDRAQLDFGAGMVEQFDQVVVAAGPWVSSLLPTMADRVTPSRQMVVYMDLPEDGPWGDLRQAWTQAPMLLDIDPHNGFYAVPPVAGHRLKIGDHKFTMRGDPDDDRDVLRDHAQAVVDWAAARLQGFDRTHLESGRACFYTVQQDERFILEPVGAKAFVMSGFSGHGFKFGALMGESMARLVLGQQDAASVRDWAAGLALAA